MLPDGAAGGCRQLERAESRDGSGPSWCALAPRLVEDVDPAVARERRRHRDGDQPAVVEGVDAIAQVEHRVSAGPAGRDAIDKAVLLADKRVRVREKREVGRQDEAARHDLLAEPVREHRARRARVLLPKPVEELLVGQVATASDSAIELEHCKGPRPRRSSAARRTRPRPREQVRSGQPDGEAWSRSRFKRV